MKHIIFNLAAMLLLSLFGTENEQQPVESDALTQYRDTLIGNFSGYGIDTLICEPIDSLSKSEYEDDVYGGQHYKWRVYTKNNSVKPLIIEGTTGIHFVAEGDLDHNGTDEWGYVMEWPTSNWMNYNAFTNVKGKWLLIIPPVSIWLPHLDQEENEYYATMSVNDFIQPAGKKGFLKVRSSSISDDGVDFLIIENEVKIKPRKLRGCLK